MSEYEYRIIVFMRGEPIASICIESNSELKAQALCTKTAFSLIESFAEMIAYQKYSKKKALQFIDDYIATFFTRWKEAWS